MYNTTPLTYIKADFGGTHYLIINNNINNKGSKNENI